jgi:hypothetical protein
VPISLQPTKSGEKRGVRGFFADAAGKTCRQIAVTQKIGVAKPEVRPVVE